MNCRLIVSELHMPGLYFHIPYCERKCIYCDFYSIESTNSLEHFLHCLNLEIDRYASFVHRGVEFQTVYFGGGTPSLLKPETIGSILEKIHRNFRIQPAAEVTLEANPGTVDQGKLRAFRDVGISRLSIGIQSFHDSELKFLSRIHTAEEAIDCVRMAQRAGFENISLDLIFALPGQSLQAWKENLEIALILKPQHISAYSLIVEEGTPLRRMVERGEVPPPSEELESEMYLYTMECLAANGFEHYEVSNYAKPGFRSRHNSLYWNHGMYLGFGPSAHSFWVDGSLQKPTRWWNVASVSQYCDLIAQGKRPLAGQEHLTQADLLVEEIFLGLRSGGINIHALQRDYGVNLFERFHQKLKRYIQEEMLTIEEGNLRLTTKGFLHCDGIALDLIT